MNKFFEKVKAAFVAEGRFSPAITAVLLAILVALNGIVYALTNYFGLYVYPKDMQSLALSGTSDALFEQMAAEDREVEILFCMAEEDLIHHDTGAFVHYTATQLAERYQDVISIEYMNILTKRDSKGNNRAALMDEYKKALSEGEVLRDTSVVFTYKTATGRQHYRVLTDNTSIGFASFFMLDASGNAVAYNGEEILSAMSVLTTENPPKLAYFTQYHGEIADVSMT